ncbi:S-adenosylmethionine:tRNA ribosyltransferase-isomerase [Streptomyces sp. 846.5]|nr:S-adenosylmethionine:tRNA ribosyltransferase-isomerase [Streptomyces sp. 846.5]TDU03538.1 S-adenosylmethionine:tRNA ribosyltransferase-isomerase [Streptomyces sp. 846.5]
MRVQQRTGDVMAERNVRVPGKFPAPGQDRKRLGKRGDRAGHLAAPAPDPVAALDGFGLDEFELPDELEATAPPEERGRTGRDDVRLLYGGRGPHGELTVGHHAFRELPQLLHPGDVLVVNVSATLPAAVDGRVAGSGEQVVVHFSTRRSRQRWVVELRTPDGHGSTRQRDHRDGAVTVLLAGGASLRLLEGVGPRLWAAEFTVPDPLAYLAAHGRAIRYAYTDGDRPLAAYQTVFARPPAEVRGGSAEMPSAARPFTAELVARLVSRGVQIVPITLHTGVASLESHEPPYAEWFEVPEPTVRVVQAAKRAGSRVIAVGTTAVRALESAADRGDSTEGVLRAASGWTELVITPQRGVRVVDGILTGLHEPRASHLLMLEAIAGRPLLDLSYAEALRERYLWHEFGDLHLILSR